VGWLGPRGLAAVVFTLLAVEQLQGGAAVNLACAAGSEQPVELTSMSELCLRLSVPKGLPRG